MSNFGFFKDEKGNKSANRLIFIIGMFWLMGITSVVLLKTSSPDVISITTMFVTISSILYGGKLVQKHQETKK